MPSVKDIIWVDVRIKKPPVASLDPVAAWGKSTNTPFRKITKKSSGLIKGDVLS